MSSAFQQSTIQYGQYLWFVMKLNPPKPFEGHMKFDITEAFIQNLIIISKLMAFLMRFYMLDMQALFLLRVLLFRYINKIVIWLFKNGQIFILQCKNTSDRLFFTVGLIVNLKIASIGFWLQQQNEMHHTNTA